MSVISCLSYLPQQCNRQRVYDMNPRISPLTASTVLAPRVGGFSAASISGLSRGASRGVLVGDRVQQKGRDFSGVHGLQFCPSPTGNSSGNPIVFFAEAPVKQMELALLGRLDAPSVVPPELVGKCKTYREAVKLCWALRRVKSMTQAQLAEQAELYAPHVTGYLHDGKTRRDLPGGKVHEFEGVCGNTAISQWHSHQAKLTVLEEMQLVRRAA